METVVVAPELVEGERCRQLPCDAEGVYWEDRAIDEFDDASLFGLGRGDFGELWPAERNQLIRGDLLFARGVCNHDFVVIPLRSSPATVVPSSRVAVTSAANAVLALAKNMRAAAIIATTELVGWRSSDSEPPARENLEARLGSTPATRTKCRGALV